jgi:hypothetical protein
VKNCVRYITQEACCWRDQCPQQIQEIQARPIQRGGQAPSDLVTDNMDPTRRTWLEKKKMILDRDTWFTRSHFHLCLLFLDFWYADEAGFKLSCCTNLNFATFYDLLVK